MAGVPFFVFAGGGGGGVPSTYIAEGRLLLGIYSMRVAEPAGRHYAHHGGFTSCGFRNVAHMYGEFQDVAFRNDLAII